jgi:hypothetical protein
MNKNILNLVKKKFFVISKVLRGCCLHCHTIQCSNAEKYLFSMQMLYLKHGQTNEIDNLQSIYKTWILERKSLDTFYEQINEHMNLTPPSSTEIESTTKNLLAIRQELIKDFESKAFKIKSLHFFYKHKNTLN